MYRSVNSPATLSASLDGLFSFIEPGPLSG
jgi:hypothetical protein